MNMCLVASKTTSASIDQTQIPHNW
jgi:hypothetical protein